MIRTQRSATLSRCGSNGSSEAVDCTSARPVRPTVERPGHTPCMNVLPAALHRCDIDEPPHPPQVSGTPLRGPSCDKIRVAASRGVRRRLGNPEKLHDHRNPWALLLTTPPHRSDSEKHHARREEEDRAPAEDARDRTQPFPVEDEGRPIAGV